LQPICLPDEINHQRVNASSKDDEPVSPRKLWPPRDDGIHVVLQRDPRQADCVRVVDGRWHTGRPSAARNHCGRRVAPPAVDGTV
jgi:hypothetical protein